jgi:ribosomal protein S18 acetylase RimI-like enzyme|tara:strand:- start:51 stop:374 length:324 start_codon:yes stop_codon:yes gene_type:complete
VWKKKKKKKKTTNYEALFVSSLVVDEKYRRQGIASKLLEEVELLARESEVDNVELTVNNWNANALSLYEKRGFRMLKEEGEDFKEKIMQFAEDPLRMVQKRMVMVVK